MQLKDYQTEAINKIIKKYKKEESGNIELEMLNNQWTKSREAILNKLV